MDKEIKKSVNIKFLGSEYSLIDSNNQAHFKYHHSPYTCPEWDQTIFKIKDY